jgi:polysaccharide pyruvyl transferase WcaK-like protein
LSIHIGHHFFGAGNLGDDLMLAGFLRAAPPAWRGRLTCCVPHDRAALAARFPEVQWLPYEPGAREQAIRSCAAWLGLGGAPFQSNVSRWFVDHLAEEGRLCAAAGKPMYFLGVGVQDPASLELPELQAVIRQARRVWTRDDASADLLADRIPSVTVAAAADLAHLQLAALPPPRAEAGRFTAALNFEFAEWPGLAGALRATDALAVRERVWAAQEARDLPGAERWLHARLPESERARWRLQPVETLAAWPSGEWQLSSRYHGTLIGAWAGSRAVVIGTNAKLRAAAAETGYPLAAGDDPHPAWTELFGRSRPPDPARLQGRARLAAQACAEFFAAVG